MMRGAARRGFRFLVVYSVLWLKSQFGCLDGTLPMVRKPCAVIQMLSMQSMLRKGAKAGPDYHREMLTSKQWPLTGSDRVDNDPQCTGSASVSIASTTPSSEQALRV